MNDQPELRAAELVPIDELIPHPENYRSHGDTQLTHIAASIRQNGFYRNVVVANDGTILAGHGTVLAAKRLGMTTVPAVRLPIEPDSPAALKILTADNELMRFADSDDRALAELLREISVADPTGLLGTGYDEQALAGLLMVTRTESEVPDFDAAAEWVGMPDYEPTVPRSAIIVNFETAEEREDFVAHHFDGSIYKRRVAGPWTAHWPARDEPLQSVESKWVSADA